MSGSDRDSVFDSTGLRWLLGAIGFTVGACLFVAAGALLIFVISEHGESVVRSERGRSLLALAVFAAFVAIPAYVLARRSFR